MGVYKLSSAGGLATPRTNYSSFLAGNPKFEFNSYESIATTTVGSGGQATVSFTSIPATYKHLQIRCISRGTIAATFTNVNLRFNSDSSSIYRTHWLDGNGTSALGEDSGASPEIYFGVGVGANANANVFGASVCDILDYASTNKFKVTRSLAGEDNNGNGFLGLISGLWRSTAAVTQIDITPNSGNFVQYSSFALYGIKGA
jgi:hypothetical protein